MSNVWTFCSSWIGRHMCKVLPLSVEPLLRRRFLKVFFITIWLPNHVTDGIIKFFPVDHFIPRLPSKIFILIRCSVLHIQLWRHNEGTYDIIITKHTYSSWGELAMCQVSIFSFVRFQRCRGPKFSIFPTWLPNHVTYDIIIMIETFYMSSHTSDENFFSIWQVVVEKNTKVLCKQTDRQTDRWTETQYPLLERG